MPQSAIKSYNGTGNISIRLAEAAGILQIDGNTVQYPAGVD
jgi:hypothetical protein